MITPKEAKEFNAKKAASEVLEVVRHCESYLNKFSGDAITVNVHKFDHKAVNAAIRAFESAGWKVHVVYQKSPGPQWDPSDVTHVRHLEFNEA